MIRSYTKPFFLSGWSIKEICGLDTLNSKTSEGLVAIQEHGGTILKASLLPGESSEFYLFYVVYEDNGNYEEINSYLRDVVFNFLFLEKK